MSYEEDDFDPWMEGSWEMRFRANAWVRCPLPLP